jgi:hypothetical protein
MSERRSAPIRAKTIVSRSANPECGGAAASLRNAMSRSVSMLIPPPHSSPLRTTEVDPSTLPLTRAILAATPQHVDWRRSVMTADKFAGFCFGMCSSSVNVAVDEWKSMFCKAPLIVAFAVAA